MKRLPAALGIFFVVLIAIMGMFPVSASNETNYVTTTYTMRQAYNKIKTQGRTGLIGTGMSMDWTGSGVEFNANCEGNLVFNLRVQSVYQCAYFTLYIDGVCMNRFEAKTSSEDTESVKLEVNADLTQGIHNIEFYNETECSRALVSLDSIQINGHLTEPPKNKSLLIEYIGDSYLTGYGNLVETQTTGDILADTPSISDGTQSLGVLTSHNLNADYSILAVSGYGLVCGVDGLDDNMPKFYDYVSWMRSHTKNSSDLWNTSRKPDVIVVELGDNDRDTADDNGVSDSDIQKVAKKFTEHLRSINPKAKIVWTIFGYEDQINETFSSLGGENAGLFTTTVQMESGGGKGHPTVAELHSSADELTTYLKSKVLPTISTTSVNKMNSTTDTSFTTTDSTGEDTFQSVSATDTKPKYIAHTGESSQKILVWVVVAAVLMITVITGLIFIKRRNWPHNS